MPLTQTTFSVPEAPDIRADRNYRIVLFESNLYDNALHPITGLATPGLHTSVLTFGDHRDPSFTYLLNRPGSASFTLPLQSDESLAVVGYEVRRSITVFADPQFVGQNPIVMWSGFISAVRLQASSASISVTCTGWMELLYHREFRKATQFVSQDAGVIMTRLLHTANNQIANDNTVTGSGGTTAEDLLYGAGELDDLGCLAGAPVNFDAGYPAVNTAWARSGSGSMQFVATNKNAQSYVSFKGIDSASPDRFPVDANSNYNIHGWVNVAAMSGAGTFAGIQINWFTSANAFISASSVNYTSAVGEAEMDSTVVSPPTAAYAVAYMLVSTPASGAVTISYDGFTISKNNVKKRTTPIRLGTVDSPANPTGANRTRSYKVGDKIGQMMEELSNVESGVDWEVATRQTTITGGTTFVREMNVKWTLVKAATTVRGIGQDRPNVVFGLNFAGNNTLSDLEETRDASNIANRVNGRGQGQLAMAQNTTAMDTYGLWEDSVSVSDTVDSNVLLGYAGAETAYRSTPTRRFNPTPVAWDGGSVPRFKIDYDVGDIAYMVADVGAMQVGRENNIKQPIRIFGLTVSPDANGNEKISNFQTTMSQ